MKKLVFLTFIVGTIFGCRPIKKVTAIDNALEKKDTIQTTIVTKDPEVTKPSVDSLAIVQDVLKTIEQKRIQYNTFNAKIKVEFYGQEENENFTVYLSIIKDSVIYAQLKGALGIVGMQAKITKDSVIIVRKYGEKYIQKRSISYLQELTKIPFDYNTVQDILVGNPIFINNNIVTYKITNENLLVFLLGNQFKNLLTIDNQTKQVLHSKLDDIDILKNRTCDITYSNYVQQNNVSFSTYRSISVSEKSKLDVNMDFKDYSFNEPLKYVFTLPKNFKIK
ncbi:MAG: DUF4292 domain-containing protein [Chitinophagaceae bacterium]|jgi:hypothetical protein